MKVFFAASNPVEGESLRLDREITELQRWFQTAVGEPARLLSYPNLTVEELPLQIARDMPDILHITAHGDGEALSLTNTYGDRVPLTGKMLRRFLNYARPPRLVYLSACNSAAIAADLVNVVPMAIGTTASITNINARSAALLFYDRLLSGQSVEDAFQASQASIETLQGKKTSSTLFKRGDIDPSHEILHQVPRIVAHFADGKCTASEDGDFDVYIGIFGCPCNTSQVVIYTDDSTWIDATKGRKKFDHRELFQAAALCVVVRNNPTEGAIWSNYKQTVYGDYRIFVSGITPCGAVFSVASTLCNALEEYEKSISAVSGLSAIPDCIRKAITQLRDENGARIPYSMALKKRKTRRVVAERIDSDTSTKESERSQNG